MSPECRVPSSRTDSPDCRRAPRRGAAGVPAWAAAAARRPDRAAGRFPHPRPPDPRMREVVSSKGSLLGKRAPDQAVRRGGTSLSPDAAICLLVRCSVRTISTSVRDRPAVTKERALRGTDGNARRRQVAAGAVGPYTLTAARATTEPGAEPGRETSQPFGGNSVSGRGRSRPGREAGQPRTGRGRGEGPLVCGRCRTAGCAPALHRDTSPGNGSRPQQPALMAPHRRSSTNAQVSAHAREASRARGATQEQGAAHRRSRVPCRTDRRSSTPPGPA
ncbi:hypothetical protein EES45_02120 [Streptomyces sp. ADI97-07]|nr:hypothetical protein EES45_02120 [Streptomyces sp. ADI97-07]